MTRILLRGHREEQTLAVNDNYTVGRNKQFGMYYIRGIKQGSVPKELEGRWTHKHLAEKALVAWVEKQRGATEIKSGTKPVRKRANN